MKFGRTICAFGALIALIACTESPAPQPDPTNLREPLKIASDATFPPFHFVDDDGRVTGFDIELARKLAERAGFESQVVVVPYDQLFDELLAGTHDVVAASTGITPERQAIYLFSSPYFDTCQAALVREGVGEPENLEDLANLRVGAAGAGTSVRALNRLPNVQPVLLSEREATEETIAEDGTVQVLDDREVDALIVDELDAVDAARRASGKYRVLPQPVALEQYGFVYAPDSTDLKRAFDEALANMRADGSLRALQVQYGLDRDEDWPVKIPAIGER